MRQIEPTAARRGLFPHLRPLLIVMIAMMLGNFVQIVIWGVLFLGLGEFNALYDAVYHSGVNFTSLGYGDVVMSARWKLTFDPWYVQEWGRIGWETGALPRIALVQLTCVVLYLVPRTSVFGALLLTGYLGGAVATHVRIGSPLLSHVLFPIYVALLLWGGLYFRETRLRELVPFRRQAAR